MYSRVIATQLILFAELSFIYANLFVKKAAEYYKTFMVLNNCFMKKTLIDDLLTEVITAIFIFLFLYTGINKLIGHTEFQVVLSKSPLLSHISHVLSWLLPVFELFVAILLFIPASKKIGLVCSMILMSIFTFYIAFMLLFTPDLPCSCGGVLQQLNWPQHLFLNIFFLLLSMLAMWLSKKHQLFIAINRNSRTPV